MSRFMALRFLFGRGLHGIVVLCECKTCKKEPDLRVGGRARTSRVEGSLLKIHTVTRTLSAL